MAKEVTDLDLFGGGAGEDDFFGSMSDSSQPSSATSAAAAAASLASPGSGDDLFGTGGDAGDYDDIFGLGDPGGSSYGGSATQPAPAPEPEVAPVAALKAAAPAPTELEVKADAPEQDTAAVEELNSPQLFGDDGGDFMAALSMRDPEPQPAPQPAYRPAPQPAPQPAPLPAPQPAYQPAPQPAPQPSAYEPAAPPAQAVDPISQKLGFAVAKPAEPAAQPNAWRELRDSKGRTYYFNMQTQESRWDQPAEMVEAIRNGTQQPALDTPWEELEDSHGRVYFFNTLTEKSRWTKPPEMIEAERQAEQRQIIAAREREEQERQAQASHFAAAQAQQAAMADMGGTAGPQVVTQIAAPTPAVAEQLNPSALTAAKMPKWQELRDDRDRVYYYNPDTQESRWTKPEELAVGMVEQRAAAEALARKAREEQERQAQHFGKQPVAQPVVQTTYAAPSAYQPPLAQVQGPVAAPAPVQQQQPQPQPPQQPQPPYQSSQPQQFQQQQSYPVHQAPASALEAVGQQQFSSLAAPAPAPAAAAAATWSGEGIDPNSLEARNVPHCFASFGFGGQLVVSFPEEPQQWSVGEKVTGKRSSLQVVPIGPTLQADPVFAEVAACPGPLDPANAATKDAAVDYLTAKVALAGEDLTDQIEQARCLLWLYLLHVVHNDGNFYPADSFAQRLREQHQASQDVFSSASSPSSSPKPPLRFPTSLEPQMQLAAQAVEDLMQNGQFREACQCALDAELWDVALMLACTKAQDMWQVVSLQYIQSRFDSASPTSTLMHVLAGHSDKVFDGDALNDWREKLSLLLQSTSGQDSAATISGLADSLHSDGQLFGAHLCWLLCGVNELDALGPEAKMSLVGIDGRQGLTLGSLLMTIQMTELYEYSRRQLVSSYSIPTFQTYKLMYACMFAEMGDMPRTRQYCDQIVQMVASVGEDRFAPIFVERLRDLQSQVYGECELVHNALGEATKRQAEAAQQAYQQQQQAQYAYQQALAEQARQAQAQGQGQGQMQPDGQGGYYMPTQPDQAVQGQQQQQQHQGGPSGAPPPPSPQEPNSSGGGDAGPNGTAPSGSEGGGSGGDAIGNTPSKSILGGLGNILSQTISSVTNRYATHTHTHTHTQMHITS